MKILREIIILLLAILALEQLQRVTNEIRNTRIMLDWQLTSMRQSK